MHYAAFTLELHYGFECKFTQIIEYYDDELFKNFACDLDSKAAY